MNRGENSMRPTPGPNRGISLWTLAFGLALAIALGLTVSVADDPPVSPPVSLPDQTTSTLRFPSLLPATGESDSVADSQIAAEAVDEPPADDQTSEPTGDTSEADDQTVKSPTVIDSSTEMEVPIEKASSATILPEEASLEYLGQPLAGGMIQLLQNEIAAGLKKRRIDRRFSQFEAYAGIKLRTSLRSRSELKGNCRLDWYDHLMRNPLQAPLEAETFTRQLHLAALDRNKGLERVLATAADKLDLQPREVSPITPVTSPVAALDIIEQALINAKLAYTAALAPLSKSEISTLTRNLYPIMTSQNKVGHTLQSRTTGKRLCDLLEKLDRDAMHSSAEALLPIATPSLLEALACIEPAHEPAATGMSHAVPGVSGPITRRIDTAAGMILIGGREANTYELDKIPGLAAVIDQGGEDSYLEGRVSFTRPVLVIVDLGGNDQYRATQPGVQGAAVLGVSMLLDCGGDDLYQAKDVAQGSCLAGAGILIDYAGDDRYIGVRRVQGEALGGLGILIDRGGDDSYHAAMWAQGFGAPLGFGLLDDLAGKDHYYSGGLYLNSYLDDDNPTPGYEGWGQGVGSGLRAVANGGIGVILDGGGDDIYEYDYLSHAGGYWCGVGFARDFGGNDQRLGATKLAYNGRARTQRRYQRFGNGFGCHYAQGFLFDDQGNDTYNGTIMCLGFAWDCAAGYLCDFGGNDAYSGSEGNGAQAGLGVLFDYDGDDNYLGSKQGRASSSISYHDMPQCGGNFSFVVDYGGTDKYGCRAKNNSYNRRLSSGGFLIDRPRNEEAEETAQIPTEQRPMTPETRTRNAMTGQ